MKISVLSRSIDADEKEAFAQPETSVTSQDAELNGTLISLNKESMKGTFKRSDGKKIPYHFIGDKEDLFFSGFTYKGLVRIAGTAHFDENLELKRLEIARVIRLQTELGFDPGSALA
jgi:hypothetical protein